MADREKYYSALDKYYSGQTQKVVYRAKEIHDIIRELQIARQKTETKTRREYHLLSTYDLVTIGDSSHLIKKNEAACSVAPDTNNGIRYVVAYEELFDILSDYHANKTGHGGRSKMMHALQTKYYIPRPPIEIFISSCRSCNEKKSANRKVVVRPIISHDFGERGQVDLIDFQSLPDGQFKWILNYQDHTTKFLVLRALVSKRAEEVAHTLLQIFLFFGAPKILQSDNGREFVNAVIEELVKLWPECIIVRGRPRHPQSQGSIERSNQDVENMIRGWMTDNSTHKWSIGLQFVQWQKNSSHHRVINRSPYQALFGFAPKLGLASTAIPTALAKTLKEETELEAILTGRDPIRNNGDTSAKRKQPDEDITESIPDCDTPEEEDQTLRCFICGNSMSSVERKCTECPNIFHSACMQSSSTRNEDGEEGVLLLCPLCHQEKNIVAERNDTHKRMKLAATKMVETSRKKIPKLKKGDNVLMPVPKVDRGPADPPNLLCQVVDARNGVFQIACGKGVIKGWYGAETLIPAGAAFLNTDDIDRTTSISLRQAVTQTTGGQGFKKCNCRASRKQCGTKKCSCFAQNQLCTSKCHESLSCKNK